jgi:hypothetical protein
VRSRRNWILRTLVADFVTIAVLLFGLASNLGLLVFLGLAVLTISIVLRTALWLLEKATS